MVNITINGKQLEVEEGTTVLNAARLAGINIPTLCDHPELTPYGGCRLCLVEVEGARTLQPSCTLPVSNNMKVLTNTQKVQDARKFILNMIFSERNHFCPYCQVSGGDCELQNAAYHEGMTHWSIQPNWKPYPVDASHPFFILEHNRCILCRRCVRACGELVGNFTLGFEERGANSALVADLGIPLGESSCVGCGTCVQVCPTGALIDRWSAYQGRETEVEHQKTICIGCSVGCGIDVLTRDNRLVRIEGDWDSIINKGVICDVGRFHPMVEKRERILTPMVRKNGSLKAASWAEAIDAVSAFLDNNPDKTTGYISTRLPIEALSTFEQLCTGLGVRVTSLEGGVHTSAGSFISQDENSAIEGKIEDLHQTDCILVVGEDITKNHQVISFFVKRRLPNGCKLIVLNSSKTTGFDNFADINIHCKQGTEKAVLEGIASVYKSGKKDFDQTETLTGVKKSLLEQTLVLIKSSKHPFIVYGLPESEQKAGDLLTATYFLAQTISAGLLDVKGGANSLAAAQLNLDQPLLTNNEHNGLIFLADEIPSQKLIKSLEKFSQTVVVSSYISPITANAQVILPVQNWLEQEGHYLNLDGHLQKAKAALNAPEDIRSSVGIIELLANKKGIILHKDWDKAITKRISATQIA